MLNQPNFIQGSPVSAEAAPVAPQFMSPTIGKLAEALAKAQSEIRNAAKDKDNPFFKSTYADLASVWDACRDPLTKNNLSVVQLPNIDPVSGKTVLTTLLMHSSGEWLSSVLPVIPVKQDPQGMGSAITYMRRFALSSIAGVAPAEKPTADDVDDDDDGNAAAGRNFAPAQKVQNIGAHAAPKAQAQDTTSRNPSTSQLGRMFAIAKQSNVSNEQIKAYIFNKWNRSSSKDLSLSEYDQLCDTISAEGLPPVENQSPAPGAQEKSSVTQESEEKKQQWFKNRSIDPDPRMVK